LHAILTCNRNRQIGFTDGVVVTPLHSPPEDGSLKYNPTNGGLADIAMTAWIERTANVLFENDLDGLRRVPHGCAHNASRVHGHDYVGSDLADPNLTDGIKITRQPASERFPSAPPCHR